ncbi:MAG: DUF2312 domain-containing protein [Bauldia sp.]
MAGPVSVARDQLKSIVERIERLEEEKRALADDIKEVFAEAKGNGFDTKVLRTVIRLRKQDKNERQEQEALLDLYLHALGMAAGAAAGEKETD